MPYIKQEDREVLDKVDLGDVIPNTPGELNYCISTLIESYLWAIKTTHGKWKYQHLNDVLGALEGAKLEFYRRMVAPYENNKIEENGDVY